MSTYVIFNLFKTLVKSLETQNLHLTNFQLRCIVGPTLACLVVAKSPHWALSLWVTPPFHPTNTPPFHHAWSTLPRSPSAWSTIHRSKSSPTRYAQATSPESLATLQLACFVSLHDLTWVHPRIHASLPEWPHPSLPAWPNLSLPDDLTKVSCMTHLSTFTCAFTRLTEACPPEFLHDFTWVTQRLHPNLPEDLTWVSKWLQLSSAKWPFLSFLPEWLFLSFFSMCCFPEVLAHRPAPYALLDLCINQLVV